MANKPRIISRAWTDQAFKKRLLERPKEVFFENGIYIPSTVNIKVVENTASKIYLVLVPPPSGEISEEHRKLHETEGGKPHFGLSSIVEDTVFNSLKQKSKLYARKKNGDEAKKHITIKSKSKTKAKTR